MFLKSFMFLGLLAITSAADILTFKITDFQGSVLDLTSGSPKSLTPVQSFTATKNTSQNWLFIFAAHGDDNEYRILNAAGSSILSYATANSQGPAIHTQIMGNQNVSTNWDVVPVPKGSVNFIEKQTRLAITAWPVGSGKSRSSPLTLETYDAGNPRQVFKLTQPPALEFAPGVQAYPTAGLIEQRGSI
ncbi:hypothetical protein C8R44DRAFT_806035 [Mycena epipterygia]|nr:hypothetical protein C8R44DRAFT_806035 [Mycena epipterygia]